MFHIPRVVLTSQEGGPRLCVIDMFLPVVVLVFENVITDPSAFVHRDGDEDNGAADSKLDTLLSICTH